jgi:hypothetical protein
VSYAPEVRSFHFVPFGSQADGDAVCCDGLVPGAGLHLSHWEGNETPPHLKADTSTEIALRCAREGSVSRPVVNNHFDADGALSVWALLDPDTALAHQDLIVAAAEAGDFDEWPSNERGLWLEAAITKLAQTASDDAAAYRLVLAELPSLVANLEARRELWEEQWQRLQSDEVRAAELAVARIGDIAVFHHRRIAELAGPVLSKRAPQGVKRWLLAFEDDGGRFRYRYELPRYAWADTVARPLIDKPDADTLVSELGKTWTTHAPGMTGLAATSSPIDIEPGLIAERLREIDEP